MRKQLLKAPKKYHYIIELGKALHTYGVPSYKIQTYLSEVSKKKGIKGSFMDFPTWINYVFYEDQQSYNYIECIPPGSYNLGALSKISELTDKVIANEIKSTSVNLELEAIKNEAKHTNHYISTLGYAFTSGAFSLMIGTNWISFGFSLILGALIYFMLHLSTKSRYLETVFESLSAFLVTIFSCFLFLIFPEFNIAVTVLSAIIIFIPGLAITTALEEITSKNLVSGSAKLFDAIISLFKQFFGVLLGLAFMAPFIKFKQLNHISEIPEWVMFLAIPVFSIALLPIFQVRKKDMLLGVITGVSGFFITVAFSKFGLLFSSFIGSISVVAISVLFNKITKSPKTVYLTLGIIMLVPGSKSFMGLSRSYLQATFASADNVFEQVAFILMGIIGGLLFAGVFRDVKNYD